MFFKKDKIKNGGSAYDYLIVGLGNPGVKYEMTRHNAGFLAVDLFAIRENISVKRLKFHALVGDITLAGKRCLIMKPQTMMNCSGDAVREAASFYKIPPERILVLFDDVSLDIGQTRIRRKGSAGGHNGIKSIIAQLGCEEFPRIKIGVGKKPHPEYDLAVWVLGKFPKENQAALKKSLENACDAIGLIVGGNMDEAMNRYNS